MAMRNRWFTLGTALFILFIYAKQMAEGLDVTFAVLLPEKAISRTVDDCPPLDISRIETELVQKSLENFTWTNSVETVNIQFTYNDTQCSDVKAPVLAMELFYHNIASILYGPCCKYALSPVGRYAGSWNLPIITPGGLADAFSNRTSFPLLTRVMGNYKTLAHFVKKHILEKYNWTHVSFLYHNNIRPQTTAFGNSPCDHMVAGIRKIMRPDPDSPSDKNNHTVNAFSTYSIHWDYFDESDYCMYHMTNILYEIRNKSRIVIMCGTQPFIRKTMIRAANLNFDNGQFAFINIDLFGSQMDKPWFSNNESKQVVCETKNNTEEEKEKENEEENEKARRMYDYVLTVTLLKPNSDKYRAFAENVKQQYTGEINSFVGAFHDSVMLYALALNETLAAGYDSRNGTDITHRMWNRTFEGITGNVTIDEFGDRVTDFSLLDMNKSGFFEVVANYYGSEQKYEEVHGKRIHWGGNRTSPPPNIPECGFDDLGCPKLPAHVIVIIVLGILLCIVSFVAFFLYRHYKLEAELAEENWRVRWDDIMFGVQEKRKLGRSGSRLSLMRKGSMQSLISTDTITYHLSNIATKQIFTKTGSYKGTLVAIKKINKQVTITKPLLFAIRKLRSLQNDHIVRFIGLCIDGSNQCILTEYCQKGSLQDVLENEEIKLDNMFKFSLIQDIVRGVAYLQSSDIRSHGNLKSSNCVVDSRFVLKITDFGLPNLRAQNEVGPEDTYAYYRAKLWTAPEILRLHSPPLDGTPKADVYAFAIICQEIIHRNGPFWVENVDISPQEIYKLVKNGQKPYFRPTLLDSPDDDVCSEDLANMIRRCWSEDPLERPDFHTLKTAIKRINKGNDCSGNLLDNLLSRMEQYAYNLEALVEERTADYLEQKKRAEDLLYTMLPRSVAGQLMLGKTVEPEKFECVTIYFSDICDFTSLSAKSTPMEVVDLLNDLYTTFDSITDSFDVYKVETIGDAYFVVSGLPVRNGNQHAPEIARAAITLLNAVKCFKIRHRPQDQLKLRIGIHSGPVCAGIVGLKMPRYCLIGDTVNTASRMESNGEPFKIHVSQRTKELLDSFSTFVLELRGTVPIKGKGEMVTWWLLGELNPEFPEFAVPSRPTSVTSGFTIF